MSCETAFLSLLRYSIVQFSLIKYGKFRKGMIYSFLNTTKSDRLRGDTIYGKIKSANAADSCVRVESAGCDEFFAGKSA